MRSHVHSAVLVSVAALLFAGAVLAGATVVDSGDPPPAAAAGTVDVAGQVTLWGVASRVGTLVLVVGTPIAFLYWLATVNVGTSDPPGSRDRHPAERVEDAAYEAVRGKSN